LKIVFLGTKQARLICDLYRRLRGADDEIVLFDSTAHVQGADEERIATADVIAWQENGGTLPYDLDEIGARGERLRFPELTLDFLWPFGGQPHIRNTSDPLFGEGPFPADLGDAWLNRRLGGPQQAEAIEAEYLALDIAALVDLGAFRRVWRARQSEIDRLCGADYASRIDEEFRRRPLFVNPGRPADDLMRDVAEKLFARLRPGLALPDDCRFEAAPELPLHPSVAQHFRIDWTKDRLYRGWSDERLNFAEYVRRYLAYADGPELEAGVRLAALGRLHEALAPLERATGRLSGRRSQSAQRALARALAVSARGEEAQGALAAAEAAGAPVSKGQVADAPIPDKDLTGALVLMSQSRWREAEAATQAHLARDPDACEAWLMLAQIQEKQGDGAGRVAALRRALALRPHDLGLMSQLTLALAGIGDWPGAIASAELEVAADPENPHSRAFLSSMLEGAGEAERARVHLERAIEIVVSRPEFAALHSELMKRRVASPQQV
jgi:tetratricopeptide (TPR) repeat protein